jgi:DUF4097 and DUF4098 domain-containing protein YvlB
MLDAKHKRNTLRRGRKVTPAERYGKPWAADSVKGCEVNVKTTYVTMGLMVVALGSAGADEWVLRSGNTEQRPAQRPIDIEAADCSKMRMSFGKDQVAYAVQRQVVPLSSGTLDVRPGGNGGVVIERGSGNSYSITACIGVGAETREEAQRLADGVRLSVEGNRVRVEEIERLRHGGVQLIIEAPSGARIDVETTNGPIAVDGFDGHLTARASNGPINLHNVAGVLRGVATNGPISISGSRGDIDVETQNGPITVSLDGAQWDGELEARAQNGPLTVTVPEGFQSGVEISSSSNSPWSCRIAACGGTEPPRQDGARTLRFGAEPVTVKVSTVNGPVTINRKQ